VSGTHVTLLVEELPQMLAAVAPDSRFPALEEVFARGRPKGLECPSSNHLRFALFGIQSATSLPVAALTHVADCGPESAPGSFWLRADPVTMWADMARVIMTRHGFADLDPLERDEIENCVRGVLREEGIDFHSNHPERWCIALEQPLDFDFAPLDEAVGMDVAEALPDHPEARFWKRLLNEIQVALHHCQANVRRRRSGRPEVNSVWFWGGGFIPDSVEHDAFATVYSDHPVTRGLAIINDCKWFAIEEFRPGRIRPDGRSVLVDWQPRSADAASELGSLERIVGELLRAVRDQDIVLRLLEADGQGREFDRHAGRRFWRRKRKLGAGLLSAEGP
jgi:hypothetical protein